MILTRAATRTTTTTSVATTLLPYSSLSSSISSSLSLSSLVAHPLHYMQREPNHYPQQRKQHQHHLKYHHHNHHNHYRRFYFTNGQSTKRDDPYSILGLQWGDGATTTDIKNAFKNKAKLLHPDMVRNSNNNNAMNNNNENNNDGTTKQTKVMTLEQAQVEFQRLVKAYESLLKSVQAGLDNSDHDSIEEWRVALWRQSDRIAMDRTDVAGLARKRPAPPAQTDSRSKVYGRELGHPSGKGVVTIKQRGEYLTTSSSSYDEDGNPIQQRRRPKQSSSVGRGQSKWTAQSKSNNDGNKKEYTEWDPTTTTTVTKTTKPSNNSVSSSTTTTTTTSSSSSSPSSMTNLEISNDNSSATTTTTTTTSSSPIYSSTTLSKTVDDQWLSSTERFLNVNITPVGSMDTLKWHMGETMILYWSDELRGVEGLKKSFQLLERLVMEANHHPNDDDTDASHHKKHLDIYLVHAILKNWNMYFRKNQRVLLPSEVLQKLDDMVGTTTTPTAGRRCFEPNIATYTIILDAASHCPDPSERLQFTEDLLSRLIDESSSREENGDKINDDDDDESSSSIRPTVVTFGTVIHGLANSKRLVDAEKAEMWLRRLQDLSSSSSGWSNVRPNTVIYTSVIYAWANVGRADRAEALLQEMYEEYYVRGNVHVAPTVRTFNSVLAAWSKSSVLHSVSSSEILLDKMKELSVYDINLSPNLVSYNSFLSTLVRRRKQSDSLVKAESVMEEVLDRARTDPTMIPNQITYTALFKIIEGRNDLSGIEKADRAQQWIVRSNSKDVMDDPTLLQRIHAMDGSKKGGGSLLM